MISTQEFCFAYLLFHYAHSVLISAQPDQNSQSGLLRPKKGILGGIFAPWGGPPGGTEKKFLKNDSTYWYGSNEVLILSIEAFLGAL